MLTRLKFWFFDASRLVGIRDRLRCPRCKAVGTWKPHGGPFDGGDLRKVPRWMCKWCGLYKGPEGTKQCYPDPTTNAWRFTDEVNPDYRITPDDVVNWNLHGVWPWRG